MPSFTQKLLKELEDAKAYDNPAYADLERVLTTQFTRRQVPGHKSFTDCEDGFNTEIYVAMQGASEFTIGGVLEHWSITERNATVRIPTLVVAGEFDTMSQECHQLVVNSIPTAWPLVTIPRASHQKLLDEPILVCSAVAKFLFTCETIRSMGKK